MEICGWPFTTAAQAIDETALTAAIDKAGKVEQQQPVEIATQTCLGLAAAKARAAYLKDSSSNAAKSTVYIGSDTLIWFERRILGKPKDTADARRMLHALSGRRHHVFTAVSLLDIDPTAQRTKEWTFLDAAVVTFQPLDDIQIHLIDQYIATGSPLDKAGAYGIQDAGSLLIQNIAGDFYTIMGLPITRLVRYLFPLIGRPPHLTISV